VRILRGSLTLSTVIRGGIGPRGVGLPATRVCGSIRSFPSRVWGKAPATHSLLLFVAHRNAFQDTKMHEIGVLHANYWGTHGCINPWPKILGGGLEPTGPHKVGTYEQCM